MKKLMGVLGGVGVILVALIMIPVVLVSTLFNKNVMCSDTSTDTSSSSNVAAVAQIDPKTYQPPEKADTEVAEAAAQFVEKVALDDSHGYSQARRNGNPDYDCSSLVYFSITQGAGHALSVSTPFSTHTMKQVLTASGYEYFTWSGNPKNAKNELKRGDIIVNAATHTETYLGGGLFGGARHATPSGIEDGHPGDQGTASDPEIGINAEITSGLTDAYRYVGDDAAHVTDPVSGSGSAAAALCRTNEPLGDTGAVSAIVPTDLTHASPEDARAYAKSIMPAYGWDDTESGEFGCLVWVWNHESGWRWDADNPSSDAYGIPQALPGKKMSTIASDWRDNAATQIIWGMKYIKDRYKSPCGAKQFWLHNNWY
ncbi:aggregation-promoting factor C-terminal-like domain-containing protein [Alloscardovia criceti]|uniref:aggregation-promoting factor C-terminal-like domain-containing protein n=1 Tax=Alloscardovia criceti TaxID=356828 RepID=UPI0003808B55|nr:peptidoglycan amidohydrolase family protein [Alloscardovia criceti]